MSYTPTDNFVFLAGTAYAPSNDFDFLPAGETNQGEISGLTEDISGGFSGAVSLSGEFLATTDDIIAEMSGFLALSGDLISTTDNTVGLFDGHNVLNAGAMSAVLDDAFGFMSGDYDPNVTRFTVSKNISRQENATGAVIQNVNLPRDQGAPLNPGNKSVQDQASPVPPVKLDLLRDQGTRAGARADSIQEQATSARQLTEFPREQGTRILVPDLHSLQDVASDARGRLQEIKQQMTKVYPDRWLSPIQDSSVVQADFIRLIYRNPENTYTPGGGFSFGGDYSPTKNFTFDLGQVDYLSVGHNLGVTRNSVSDLFSIATRYNKRGICLIYQETRRPPPGKTPWQDTPRDPPPTTPPNNPETLVIPEQRSYSMANTITVTLEDLTPILMDNIRLEYDADGFAWSFSGSLLDPSQVDLVKPNTDGTPLKLLVTINGYAWTILSEKISHRREYSSQSVSVSGRGVSALLAAPYREPGTGTQGSALTVAQLANTHLPPGWTVNWQAADWLVDANAYSFQGRTSIQAIKDLAEWSGAIVYPDRSAQTINIKPRYPVLPFVFNQATPDVLIPESVILSMTYRQISSKFPNGIYVHGGEVGGEIGFCRLTGTAGDVLLETQQNPIMTDPVGLRAFGERLLAGAYTQPEIEEFTTIMDGTSVPLLDLGTLLEIGGTVRGIVNKVLIEATRPTVKQTVRLGEDTQNAWQAFQSLLPADPLLIATLNSLSGNTATMTTLSGGVVKVRAEGTETPGSKYYIRSGQIQGIAPNLTETEIVI